MNEIHRIGFDGRDGLPAPAMEMGIDGIGRIKKVEQPGLELYPCKMRPSKGTVMVCPGGGYSILAITHEGRDIARLINGFGYDAAVLLYRVSEGDGTRKMALEDAKDGLTLIRERGPEFGLCSKHVGVMGFSAGGHLSARLAHDTGNSRGPDFLILIYPAYLEKNGILLDEVIPPNVPSFVYVAKNDQHLPSSLAFSEHCNEKKLRCESHQAKDGGHGFGVKNPLPEAVRDWTGKLGHFLESLKGASSGGEK